MLEFVLIIFVGKYIYTLTTCNNITNNNDRITVITIFCCTKKQGEDYRKNNNLNQD